jgi:ABC-2 type transport system ATP-binding protein
VSAPAIEATDVVVRYGPLLAVDGVSLRAEPGEVLALLGPNGAGKTTMVETLEGYRQPDAGEVRVLGLDPRTERARLAPAIGVMLQGGGSYPAMSPARVLRLFSSYYDDPRPVPELLELLDLERVSRTPARRLSGGEVRRLALALACIGRPRVAFLDEPTAGVDPAGRLKIREVIDALRREGVAVLLTTHELEEVERLADQVVILDRATVVASGSPSELTGEAEELWFRAERDLPLEALRAAVGAPVSLKSRGEYRIEAPPTPERVAALASFMAEHHYLVTELRAGRQRLEDVFLRCTAPVQQVDAERAAARRR